MAPPARLNTTRGPAWARARSPTMSEERVMRNTWYGRATTVICRPMFPTSWPIHSSRKSRESRRGLKSMATARKAVLLSGGLSLRPRIVTRGDSTQSAPRHRRRGLRYLRPPHAPSPGQYGGVTEHATDLVDVGALDAWLGDRLPGAGHP